MQLTVKEILAVHMVWKFVSLNILADDIDMINWMCAIIGPYNVIYLIRQILTTVFTA